MIREYGKSPIWDYCCNQYQMVRPDRIVGYEITIVLDNDELVQEIDDFIHERMKGKQYDR